MQKSSKFVIAGIAYVLCLQCSIVLVLSRMSRQHKMSIPNKLPHYTMPVGLRQCVLQGKELTSHAVHLTQVHVPFVIVLGHF